jgi:membrane protease YdiL (CAAX protease family)
MSVSESILSWCFLVFQLFIMPHFLDFIKANVILPFGNSWLTFLCHCISFIALMLICHNFLTNAATALSKDMNPSLSALGLGFCIYYTCTTLLGTYLGSYFPDFFNPQDSNIAPLLRLDFIPMSIGTIFLVPFIEEVLYRGLVFRSLYNKNHAFGYVLSTLIFSSVHLLGIANSQEPVALVLSFLQYVPASFTLAWTYVKADNIFAPIMLHMIINAMGVYSMR